MPYYKAALVITILGCGVAALVARRRAGSRVSTFFTSAGATLVLICSAALAVDVGEVLGWWMGPRILLISWVYLDAMVVLKLFIPPSILGGAVAVGENILRKRQLSSDRD